MCEVTFVGDLQNAVSEISWVHKLIYFSEIDSTNDYLKQVAMDSMPVNGVVVFADAQSRGRGRFGKTWDSPSGLGLWFSVLFVPENQKVSELQWLRLGASACMKVIERLFHIDVEFKYPNDLLVQQKKLCGILTETVRRGPVIQRVILGIGMNVNQESLDFNASVRDRAVSLKMISGRKIERIALFGQILRQLEQDYLAIQ